MKASCLIFLFFLTCFNYSCWKDNYKITRYIIITGTVTDKENNQPVGGVPISVDAIAPLSQYFSLRKLVGQAITDSNGHYKINAGIFNGVQNLQFFINQGKGNSGYSFTGLYTNISNFDLSKPINEDLTLVPLAILNISYKNVVRYSDSDLFRFEVFSNAGGITVNRTYCGSVHEDTLAADWIGTDVCGTNSLTEAADQMSVITWDVYRKGVHHSFEDSVFVKRGVITNYDINY